MLDKKKSWCTLSLYREEKREKKFFLEITDTERSEVLKKKVK